MKIVVRVELTTDWGETNQVEVARIERPAVKFQAENLGLSLEDGKEVLRHLQQAVAFAQAQEYCDLNRVCQRCHRWNPVKDYRVRKVDTVFGTVSVDSARIISCPCEPPYFVEIPFSPLAPILQERATPELQHLQAKLCAQMPYRQAAKVWREFLPVSAKFKHVTLRNRTLRVGEQIDMIAPTSVPTTNASTHWALAIDGGFVSGIGKGAPKHFGLLTGRLAAPGHKPYVFAWVSNEGDSTARVTTLVRGRTGCENLRLSVITDGAKNTQSIPQALPFPAKAILDWFHISMRVRNLEQIVSGLSARSVTEQMTSRLLVPLVDKLRWCYWHANSTKARSKLQQILVLCGIVVPETPKFKEALENLEYRARDLIAYLQSNAGTLIAYGARQRSGERISTSMAESAVNQVINARMCKRQQMRWTPRGAHLLAQVRCAVINGDLSQRLLAYKDSVIEETPLEVSQFLERMQRTAA